MIERNAATGAADVAGRVFVRPNARAVQRVNDGKPAPMLVCDLGDEACAVLEEGHRLPCRGIGRRQAVLDDWRGEAAAEGASWSSGGL